MTEYGLSVSLNNSPRTPSRGLEIEAEDNINFDNIPGAPRKPHPSSAFREQHEERDGEGECEGEEESSTISVSVSPRVLFPVSNSGRLHGGGGVYPRQRLDFSSFDLTSELSPVSFTGSTTAAAQPIQSMNEKCHDDECDCSSCSVGECSICYSKLPLRANHVFTMCGHLFCVKCLLKWWDTATTCPICRAEIFEEEDNPNYVYHDDDGVGVVNFDEHNRDDDDDEHNDDDEDDDDDDDEEPNAAEEHYISNNIPMPIVENIYNASSSDEEDNNDYDNNDNNDEHDNYDNNDYDNNDEHDNYDNNDYDNNDYDNNDYDNNDYDNNDYDNNDYDNNDYDNNDNNDYEENRHEHDDEPGDREDVDDPDIGSDCITLINRYLYQDNYRNWSGAIHAVLSDPFIDDTVYFVTHYELQGLRENREIATTLFARMKFRDTLFDRSSQFLGSVSTGIWVPKNHWISLDSNQCYFTSNRSVMYEFVIRRNSAISSFYEVNVFGFIKDVVVQQMVEYHTGDDDAEYYDWENNMEYSFVADVFTPTDFNTRGSDGNEHALQSYGNYNMNEGTITTQELIISFSQIRRLYRIASHHLIFEP